MSRGETSRGEMSYGEKRRMGRNVAGRNVAGRNVAGRNVFRGETSHSRATRSIHSVRKEKQTAKENVWKKTQHFWKFESLEEWNITIKSASKLHHTILLEIVKNKIQKVKKKWQWSPGHPFLSVEDFLTITEKILPTWLIFLRILCGRKSAI